MGESEIDPTDIHPNVKWVVAEMTQTPAIAASVLVIGNSAIDRRLLVPHFPEPGETILAEEFGVDVGGKGANQAVAAARAGATVALCSAIGGDAEGSWLKARLAAEGVNLAFVTEREGRTDQSFVVITPTAENCIISLSRMAQSIDPYHTLGALETLDPGDVLLVQGNLRRDTTEFCVREGHRRGARVLLNPSPITYPFEGIWEFVEAVILNQHEARTVTGSSDPVCGSRAIIGKGPRVVIVTLGSLGALIITSSAHRHIRAGLVQAIDTTGAGDVFCGVFAAGLASGLDAETAASWGVRVSTVSVTRHGTQSSFPSREEMLALRG
jgi:ribokinase